MTRNNFRILLVLCICFILLTGCGLPLTTENGISDRNLAVQEISKDYGTSVTATGNSSGSSEYTAKFHARADALGNWTRITDSDWNKAINKSETYSTTHYTTPQGLVIYEVEATVSGCPYIPPKPQPPIAPKNIVASEIGSRYVTLTWSASPGAKEYPLHMNYTYYGKTTETSFTFRSLTPDTTYRFTIFATNDAGSSFSSIQVKTTPLAYGALVVTAGTVQGYCYGFSDLASLRSYAQQNAITNWEAYTKSSWSYAINKSFNWLVDPAFTTSGYYFVYVQASGCPELP